MVQINNILPRSWMLDTLCVVCKKYFTAQAPLKMFCLLISGKLLCTNDNKLFLSLLSENQPPSSFISQAVLKSGKKSRTESWTY